MFIRGLSETGPNQRSCEMEGQPTLFQDDDGGSLPAERHFDLDGSLQDEGIGENTMRPQGKRLVSGSEGGASQFSVQQADAWGSGWSSFPRKIVDACRGLAGWQVPAYILIT